MKLLTTALLLVLAHSSALAADPSTAPFSFAQQTSVVNLEQKQFETVYRTDQVPSTCYRSEVQGTTTECHTEYDRSCQTEYREECHDESYPVCESVPRESCSSEDVCSTESDSVCNSQGCTSIPRRVCHSENQCHTTSDSVCHNESRRECRNEPRESCQNIPREACEQVPNVVQVPYACTKPVQVPIGQQLKMETKATLNISLSNFAEVGPLSDAFTAKLNEGNASFALTAPSTAYLYQIVSQVRNESLVSPTEKQVTYAFVLQATSIQKLNNFLSFKITDPVLFFDRLQFGFTGTLNVPFKGHLKLVQRRRLAADAIVVDNDFKSSAIVNQGNQSVLSFNTFRAGPLKSSLHYVTLSLGLDLSELSKSIVNPDALKLINNQGQPLVSDTSAYPQQ